ncbi:MAG: hypothetical protein ABIK65_01690 [Candidatus Eisenbacteria bacterium]
MKLRRAAAPAVMMLALFFGCVDYDERLTLSGDGSGRVEIRMAVDKESYETMRSIGEEFGNQDSPIGDMDRGRIEQALKERKSKAKIERFSESENGGDKVWEIAFTFESMDDLAAIGYALDEKNDEVPFTFEKLAGGGWLYRRDLEQGGSGATETYAMDEGKVEIPGMGAIDPQNFDPSQLQAQMEEMMKNMENLQARMEQQQAKIEHETATRRIRFSVNFPGDVVESNATEVKGKTAVWEYGFDDLQKMEGKIPALTARVK